MKKTARHSHWLLLLALLALGGVTIYAHKFIRGTFQRTPKPAAHRAVGSGSATQPAEGIVPVEPAAPAQSGGNFNITESGVLSGGGGGTGGSFSLTDSIGQLLSGMVSGGVFTLMDGFQGGGGTAPTITASAPLARQQGSPVTNSQIATVSDPEQAANTLTVQVNNAASATVNGVTVSNLIVGVGGNVTADVIASCAAANATFTLKVTDDTSLTSIAMLTVNVTANSLPTLGSYPATSVAVSGGTTVTPSAAPTDNGSVANVTASAPGFTGMFSGNTATGVITISNAGPAGNYTVTVTATDNCGATTMTTFALGVGAQTLTVNSTADDASVNGNCTLREAIQAANTNLAVDACAAGSAGLDNIVFNVGAGTPSISVLTALPVITEAVLLDGATGGATRVELNGGNLGANRHGLNITAGNSVIRGMIINRFTGAGIQIASQGSNTVQNCLIGVNTAGTVAQANARGIVVDNTANNTIGGTAANTSNVIAGNTQDGIQISGLSATDNEVLGNFIGTDAGGTLDLGNQTGVNITGAPDNTVGGTTVAERNLISGNSACGVSISQTAATGNLVQGNFIGTNAAGTAAINNGTAGVCVTSALNNIIGGTSGTTPGGACTGACNLISGNTRGVEVSGSPASGNAIRGNFIGTRADGAAALANTANGIRISDAPNADIGGITAEARNVISGNSGSNISISGALATGHQIRGNYIGTNSAGTQALANGGNGVEINGSPNAIIGGAQVEARNVISGHTGATAAGISIVSANNNQVRGNYIGTNASGTAAVANSIGVSRAVSGLGTGLENLIGGANAGEGNLISGNTSAGIQLQGQSDSVQGNLIGTNAAGTSAIANGVGIRLNNGTAFNNLIGGANIPPGATCTGACNKIAFNTNQGVLIVEAGSVGNRVWGNSIFSNGTLGIDIAPAGITPNDLGDSDAGPNGLQNFPVITGALTLGSGANRTTTFQGMLNSAASKLYRIEFFANTTCDGSGNGEGQTFLGFTNVTTDKGGNATINITLPTPSGIVAGDFVTATATDATAMNTSEFSACVPVFSFVPAAAAFTRFVNTGSFAVATASGTAWTAVSSDPSWLMVTGFTGNGNGTVNYSLAANPNTSLRTGTISVNGNLFIVTQTGTTGLIVLEDFAGVTFQPSANWTITDGGSNGGVEARWTNQNPCGRSIAPPFAGTFAIMDAGCAGPNIGVLDEFLFTPPFNATGLGTVTIQFINQFHWDSDAPTNTGDVDVSIDGGLNWTNVLRLQNADDGVPTPNTKTIDITAQVMSNPANILVRMHYYGSGAARPALPSQPKSGSPLSPTGDVFAYWAVDFTIAGYGINPLAVNASGEGGMGSLTITTPPTTEPPTPHPWSVVSNDLWINTVTPSNGNITTTVTYQVSANPNPTPRTGTLTITGNGGFVATHTVTQAAGCAAITVNPPNPVLTAGTMGTFYTQTFTQTGGALPIAWSTSSGSLPGGLTLNGSTGVLSGTPTMTGPFTFTVRATDASTCFGERQYTLTINAACPTITVNPTNSTLTAGTVGTAYTQTFTQTGSGATISWSVSAGTVPAGLTLNPSSGVLSGTPTTAATSTFTIRATDTNTCQGERQYSLTINPSGNGLQFYSLAAPVRLLDTRSGVTGCVTNVGVLAANSTRTQAARTGCSTIPANATAIIGSITVVPSEPGFLTLFPSDATQPTVANSNFTAGEVTNNFFTVGLGATGPDAGAFKIFTSAATQVIIDLTGYYAPPGAGGLYYHPLPAPVRLLQTFPGATGCFLNGSQQLQGTNDPNANPALDLAVDGRGAGLPSPCNSIPGDAVVLVGNATTVFPQAPFGFGYLTIYPSDAARPTVASSNYGNNDIINGPFAVKLGADGKFKVYTFSTTHLVIDISGYYSTSPNDANGVGLLFNPLPKPMRLLETRNIPGFPLTGCYQPQAPIPGGAGGIRTQQVWGTCSDQPITIPNTSRAIVGNVTAINPTGAGFGTFFPGNVGTAPTVATTNYPFPVVFGYNRHYYVGLSPGDGTFKILTQFTSDYIVDVSGYFAP